MRYVRLLGAAVAFAVTVPAAAIEPLTLTSVGIYAPGHVDVTTDGITKSEFSVPLTFTATTVGGGTFDALGFCVDLAHNIYVGLNSQLATSLGYHVTPLTSDGFGRLLSEMQISAIGGLATLGFSIAEGNATDKAAQLAAIQQAIWTVEYPASTFVATGDYAPAQATYAAQFVAQSSTLRGFAQTIVADDGATQAFITNITGGISPTGGGVDAVPEPAMWIEMIAGLGLVGATSRRRRMVRSVAA